MITLLSQFDRDGFRHMQIAREGSVAIFRRTSLKSGSEHFEVVLIRVEPKTRRLPSGSTRKAGSDIYPASSDWGRLGWTHQSRETAQARFDKLLAERKSIS
jgi:hypothetical protein